MGTISTEYVNLKLAVFVCVSAESRRSDVFDLNLDEHSTTAKVAAILTG